MSQSELLPRFCLDVTIILGVPVHLAACAPLHRLGSGVTSLAAGIVSMNQLTRAQCKLVRKSQVLFRRLTEAGYDVGLEEYGSLHLARNDERMQQYRRLNALSESVPPTQRPLRVSTADSTPSQSQYRPDRVSTALPWSVSPSQSQYHPLRVSTALSQPVPPSHGQYRPLRVSTALTESVTPSPSQYHPLTVNPAVAQFRNQLSVSFRFLIAKLVIAIVFFF